MFTAPIESEKILESEWQRETKCEDRHRQRLRRGQEWGEHLFIHPSIHPHKGETKVARRSQQKGQAESTCEADREAQRWTPAFKSILKNSTPKSIHSRETNQASCSLGLLFSTKHRAQAALLNHHVWPSLDGYEQPTFVLFPSFSGKGTEAVSTAAYQKWIIGLEEDSDPRHPPQQDSAKVWRESRRLWLGWRAN